MKRRVTKRGAIFKEDPYYWYLHTLPVIPEGGSFPTWKGNLNDLYYVVGNTLEYLLDKDGGDQEFVDIEVITSRDEEAVLHKCRIITRDRPRKRKK